MNKRIKIEFYLKNRQTITEAITYQKRDDTVTDLEFEKDIDNIAKQIIINLKERIMLGNPGVYTFGDTHIVVSYIVAFQLFIEDVEDEEYVRGEKEMYYEPEDREI